VVLISYSLATACLYLEKQKVTMVATFRQSPFSKGQDQAQAHLRGWFKFRVLIRHTNEMN